MDFFYPVQTKKTKIKGALQLVAIALDAAYAGLSSLAEEGYIDGGQSKLNFQNAQGEQTSEPCTKIY